MQGSRDAEDDVRFVAVTKASATRQARDMRRKPGGGLPVESRLAAARTDLSIIGNAHSILGVFVRNAETIDDTVRKAKDIGLTGSQVQASLDYALEEQWITELGASLYRLTKKGRDQRSGI
jgi:hypothetical protein